MVPEKSDEREFLFGIELCTDLELLVRVAGVSQDLLIVGPPSSCHPLADR
jgi:hypothetical protein